MRLRDAQPEDREALQKLWRGEPFNAFYFTWKSYWETPPQGAGWMVAEHEGRVVGACHFRCRPDGVTYIYEIVTDREWRGRGVGALMVSRLPNPVELKTNDDNVASNAFYQGLGFRVVGESKTRKGRRLLHYRRDDGD